MKNSGKQVRVAFLCDVPGLWWAANKFKAGRVDYDKLRQFVGQGRQVVFNMAWLIDRENLGKFEAALKHIGYDTTVVPRGSQIDQLIHNAAMEAISHCDVVVIAASSGRYVQLQETLKDMGKQLEIWAFPVPSPIDEMNGRADKWVPIGEEVIR